MKTAYEAFANLWKKYASSDAGDGCQTCGYGATKLMDDEDYRELLRDIDKWIKEEFWKESQHG
jgi:hypothetical protein